MAVALVSEHDRVVARYEWRLGGDVGRQFNEPLRELADQPWNKSPGESVYRT